jgi:hypothetical protein
MAFPRILDGSKLMRPLFSDQLIEQVTPVVPAD